MVAVDVKLGPNAPCNPCISEAELVWDTADHHFQCLSVLLVGEFSTSLKQLFWDTSGCHRQLTVQASSSSKAAAHVPSMKHDYQIILKKGWHGQNYGDPIIPKVLDLYKHDTNLDRT